ncbi:MAG: DUF1080 domain-containing protein [Tannerella sp.]|jgi:hypothetical protein|nr:DUF1080 domain-containing protein [Tannerella sp.]
MKKADRIIIIQLTIAIVFMLGFVSMSNNSRVQRRLAAGGDSDRVMQDHPEGWQSLFNGKTLDNWKVLRYGGNGNPSVRNGSMVIPRPTEGVMTGVCWAGDPLPVNNYEVFYEARRVAGSDIFAGLTFPYGDIIYSNITAVSSSNDLL